MATLVVYRIEVLHMDDPDHELLDENARRLRDMTQAVLLDETTKVAVTDEVITSWHIHDTEDGDRCSGEMQHALDYRSGNVIAEAIA